MDLETLATVLTVAATGTGVLSFVVGIVLLVYPSLKQDERPRPEPRRAPERTRDAGPEPFAPARTEA